MAETDATEQVLEGTYQPPPEMDQHMTDLLKMLKKPEDVEDLPPEFSVEEFQGVWKVAKEKTLSGGTILFGHMKAITRDAFLSQLMTWVMSVPMMAGFSPKLYQQMTACFLEKLSLIHI